MKVYLYTKKTKQKSFNFKKLHFGNLGVRVNSYGMISEKQILLIKNYFKKNFKNNKNIKYNYCLNKIFTKKPLGSRLGGGKGSIDSKKCNLFPGDIILEVYNVDIYLFFKIIKELSYKLNIKLSIISI